jgi:hypothetical protein
MRGSSLSWTSITPLLGILAAATSFGCGASGSHAGFDPPPTDASTEAVPMDSDASAPTDGGMFASGDTGPAPGCAVESTLVYVVDESRNMFNFDPQTNVFKPIGSVSCTNQGLFSMAVDRNAVAWVHAQDGTLVRFDIRTKTCTPLPFAAAQHGFYTFGMGFSTNSAGSDDETLYVASASGLGLAKIDTSSLVLTPIGTFDKLQGRVELSGNGNAQLFGLFEASPYTLGEVDKNTAAVLSTAPQTSAPGASNFAFAFWGGDFYQFVGSDVLRYRPADKSTVKVATTTIQVVGAGVSTCAPTAPPK